MHVTLGPVWKRSACTLLLGLCGRGVHARYSWACVEEECMHVTLGPVWKRSACTLLLGLFESLWPVYLRR